MTNRQRFEKWAKRHDLKLGRIQEVTRDGPRYTGYYSPVTQVVWQAWEAQRRHFNGSSEPK